MSHDYSEPLLSGSSPESCISANNDGFYQEETLYNPGQVGLSASFAEFDVPTHPSWTDVAINYIYGFTNQNKSSQHEQNQVTLFDITTQSPHFTIEYVDFPEKIFKRQKRSHGKSKQIIEGGVVTFLLDFQLPVSNELIDNIHVRVKRINESDNVFKRVGEVPLAPKCSYVQGTKVLVQVDLDYIYEYNGKVVYELERSATDEFNKFHLIVEVVYKNYPPLTQTTKEFKLVGRKKLAKAGDKREHSDSLTSNSSEELPILSSPDAPDTHSFKDGVIKARQVVADHIQTKTLEIDGLHIGKTISTPKGDIAYTFPKGDKGHVFEEGEVVGLVPSDEDKGTYCIQKLTLKRSKDAVLTGVITRSYYLQAQIGDPSVPSETICMMGIVPVQVVGSVLANEALYASPDHPGCAISGHHLDINEINQAAFIGYAFSNRKTNDEKSVGFVQAGVSVLESAGKYILDSRLRYLEESVDGKIDNMYKSRKRSKKCICACVVGAVIFLVLLAVLLVQLFMPGSAYRYYVCEIGRKEPHASAFYNFIPYSNIYVYPRVNGIEFTFDKLMSKTHHKNYRMLNITAFNITGVRYYLNLDRCAYGGLRTTKDHFIGHKLVYGADVFAVNKNCTHAYYYDENKLTGWVQYNSVSWYKHQNLFCNPPIPWKSKELKSRQD